MTELRCSALAWADAQGIAGPKGAQTWEALGLDPNRGKLSARALLGQPDPAFRRLDPISRICVALAQRCLPAGGDLQAGDLQGTGLLLATSLGCLDSDRHFAASQHAERGIAAALFPYTLPSTALGEVALRFGLQGPSLCLMHPSEAGREGLATARAMLSGGEASALLLFFGDWVPGDKTALGALCLHPAAPDTPASQLIHDPDPSALRTELLPLPWTA